MAKKITAGISAIGAYAPKKILTNQDLEKMMDTSDEWIKSRTGIERRHITADGEFASSVAIKSVENLIERYGRESLEDVGLVILATSAPDAIFPATASMVQAHFALNAGAFDLLIACPGWLYGLSVAKGFVESGQIKKVLVIGAEAVSKIMDYEDRSTAILFGDGGGAAIVEAVAEPYGIKSIILGSDGTGAKNLGKRFVADRLPDGTPMTDKPFMNGPEVFKFAVRIMPKASLEALEKAGLRVEDIDMFVPHQANARIIEAAAQRLGIAKEKVIINVNEYGNTSTASIPLALVDGMADGRIKKGDTLVFVSFGSGLSWASMVITWAID